MNRIMSSKLTAVLFLSLALLLGGCGNKKTVSTPITGDWKQYKSTEGWSFKYPPSWDKIEDGFIKETSTGKSIFFQSKVTNLKEWEDWVKSEGLSATEAKKDLVEEINVKNRDGRYIYSYTIKLDGSETLIETTLIFDGKRRYKFYAVIPPVTMEEFKAITGSLKS